MPAIFACNYCGRAEGLPGQVQDKPAGDGPVIGYDGTTCCLDGIESCTLNGCVDSTDEVWMAGGFHCGGYFDYCPDDTHFCIVKNTKMYPTELVVQIPDIVK